MEKNENVTQINAKLNSNATVINEDISSSSTATVINADLDETNVEASTVLGDKYEILNKLDVRSGEADLYVCQYNGIQYVAKIYRRERSIKQDVLDAIKEIDSPFVATCFDTGEVDGHTYEIIPYYKEGSVQGRKVSFEELRDVYIPSLNEGLKALHDKGMVHKDLKPSNIMMNDDRRSVAIIDFGISSVLNTGATMIVTSTGMTPIYSAPETYRNMFFDISDYYSLGITLFELFTGKLPYEGMSQEEMERYVSISRIPLPDDMPRELKELILGLTYGDITYRHNKNNPNRRWSYEEVNKWLQGIKQVIPGEGVSTDNIIPYLFLNQEYTSVPSLVRALAEHWDEGKKHLFRGLLTRHFAKVDPNLEAVCKAAEVKASTSSGADDLIFWELLYGLDKTSKVFYWKGKSYLNLPAFGRDLIEQLQLKNETITGFMDGVMKNNIVSRFVRLYDAKNVDRLDAVKALEDYYTNLKDERNKKIQLYKLGYALSGQSILKVNDMSFNSIDDFMKYLKDLAKDPVNSFSEFKKISRELTISEKKLDPQFEAWLSNKGKQELIEKWKESLKGSKEEFDA